MPTKRLPPRSLTSLTFVEPMTSHLVKALPEGPEWIYELKFDGYRACLMKSGQQVELRSRQNKDLTSAYRPIVQVALQLKPMQFMMDGEIVVLDPHGRPSFQALQRRGQVPNHTLVYYAFDVLQLGGIDLMQLPLMQRRTHLPELTDGRTLRASDELTGSAAAVAAAVRELGLEVVNPLGLKRTDLLLAGQTVPYRNRPVLDCSLDTELPCCMLRWVAAFWLSMAASSRYPTDRWPQRPRKCLGS